MSSHRKQYESRPVAACESSIQSADWHLPPEESSAYSARRSPYGRLWDWKHSRHEARRITTSEGRERRRFRVDRGAARDRATPGGDDGGQGGCGGGPSRPALFVAAPPGTIAPHRDQAAILNALPAHIALLDTRGRIISVNEAWRRFGSADVTQGPGCGIGLNYLESCDGARGDGSSEAHQAAAGIRSVLSGGVKCFSIEYPCHSPTAQRWFLLMVRPLAGDRPNGAVVMHLDVTAERQTEESLRASE